MYTGIMRHERREANECESLGSNLRQAPRLIRFCTKSGFAWAKAA